MGTAGGLSGVDVPWHCRARCRQSRAL